MKKLEIKIILTLFLVFFFMMFYFIPSHVSASGYNNKIWFEEGDELTLVGIDDEAMLTISGADYDFTSVEWRSKDSNIVSVDENGNILAIGGGSTYIYATAIIEEDDSEVATSSTASPSEVSIRVASSNEATPSVPHKTATARCKVIVEVPVSGFEILTPNFTLEHKKAKRLLTYNIEPNNASNTKINWTSSDEDVATVSSKGKVTAISEGSVIITGETDDGNFSDSCNVTVEFVKTASASEAITTLKNKVDDDWEYIEKDGKITITGYKGVDSDVIIPKEIDNKTVTSIQDSAFNRLGIVSIVIPENIELGDGIFDGCENLESAVFEGKIEEIPDSTFAYCSSLNNVEIQSGLKKIGNYAFLRCNSLDSFEIPETVEEVGKNAFYHTGYTDFFIPKNVNSFESLLGIKTTNIIVDSNNTTYSSLDGILVSKDRSKLMCYPGGLLKGFIELPECITTIRDISNFEHGPGNDGEYFEIFIGKEVISVLNEPTLRSYSTIWTPPNSYMANYSKVNNMLYVNYCEKNDFWAIHNSQYELSINEKNLLSFHGFKEPTKITDFIIPSYVGSLRISTLDYAFNNVDLECLKTVTIPETIDNINDGRAGHYDGATLYGLSGISHNNKNNLMVVNNKSDIDIDLSMYEATNIPISYNRIGGEGWYLTKESGSKRLISIPAKTTVYRHFGIAYYETWRPLGEDERLYEPDNFGVDEEIMLANSYREGYFFIGWEIGRSDLHQEEIIKIKPASYNESLRLAARFNKSNSSSNSGGGGGSSSGGHKISTSSSSQNILGTWKQDEHGWWFQKQDGSYPKDEWIMNNNVWYRFDQNGYMQSGWIEVNKVKYYLNPDGAMVSNDWVLQDGKWYFFNESGAMQNGWVKWKDKWYYLNADGSMTTNIVTPDGYKIDSNGVWIQ